MYNTLKLERLFILTPMVLDPGDRDLELTQDPEELKCLAETDTSVLVSPSNHYPGKLPKSLKTTARHINNITFSRKNAKARERRLRASPDTKRSLEIVSQTSSSLSHAQSIEELDDSQTVRRQQRDPLRTFYNSRVATKEQKTQEIRTKRAWSTLAADERHFICTQAQLCKFVALMFYTFVIFEHPEIRF